MDSIEMNALDRDPDRRLKEFQYMRAKTRARLVRLPSGDYAWLERVYSLSRRPYDIRITYPDRFPFECPKAFIDSPDVSGAPHRLVDRSLCMFDDHARGGGPKTTALLVRTRAIVWIAMYEKWLVTGIWDQPLGVGR